MGVNTAKMSRLGGAMLSLAAVAVALPAFGQATLERVKRRGHVAIGYRVDASPFSFRDKAGQAVGYAVDVCKPMAQELLKMAGLAPEAVRYTQVEIDQRERFMKGGNVDLLCTSTTVTPQRQRDMGFSPPVYIASVKVLVPRSAKLTSVAQLAAGKPIVTIDNTTAADAVRAYATKNGLQLELARAVGPDAALGQVKLGWAAGYARDDVLLAEQTGRLAEGKDFMVLPEAMSSEPIAIAFTVNDSAMSTLVTQSLAEQHKTGSLAAAYDRWFVKPITPGVAPLNIPMSDALKAQLDKLP